MSRTKTGRPRGRPKHARNTRTIVQEMAGMRMPRREGTGGTGTVPFREALILQLQVLAMQGDIEADKMLDKIRQHIAPEPPENVGLLVVPEMVDAQTWIRHAEIRNKYAVKPEMPDPPPRPASPVNQPLEPPSSKPVRRTTPVTPQLPPRLIR